MFSKGTQGIWYRRIGVGQDLGWRLKHNKPDFLPARYECFECMQQLKGWSEKWI